MKMTIWSSILGISAHKYSSIFLHFPNFMEFYTNFRSSTTFLKILKWEIELEIPKQPTACIPARRPLPWPCGLLRMGRSPQHSGHKQDRGSATTLTVAMARPCRCYWRWGTTPPTPWARGVCGDLILWLFRVECSPGGASMVRVV
jgi:hypothetical protein